MNIFFTADLHLGHDNIRRHWHLYGHSHGRIKELPDVPRCDVGVDVWDFAPVPWEAIKRKLVGRKRKLSSDTAELDANMAENIQTNRDIVRGLAPIPDNKLPGG